MKLSKEAAVLFSVMFLPGMLSQAGAIDPAAWDNFNYHLVLLATAIPQIFLVVYVTELATPGFSTRLGWRRPRLGDLVTLAIAAAALLAAMTVFSMLSSLVINAGGLSESGFNWSFSRRSLIPLVVVSSVAVGYREEIFYRAYLVERGEDLGLHPAVAVGGSTLLFAAGHLYQGWAGFAVAAILGATLGAVFVWRRSLHGVAVAHGLYNALVLIIGLPA